MGPDCPKLTSGVFEKQQIVWLVTTRSSEPPLAEETTGLSLKTLMTSKTALKKPIWRLVHDAIVADSLSLDLVLHTDLFIPSNIHFDSCHLFILWSHVCAQGLFMDLHSEIIL